MSWVFVALIAYFLLALVNIGDKLLLGNFIPNYKVYTLLIALLGVLIFILAPWLLSWPGLIVFAVSMVSGALFVLALLAFFYSLHVGEAGRVIPFIGGLVPVFSLVFSFAFLGESFTRLQFIAFFLLIIGSIIIVRMPHKTHWWEAWWEKIHPQHKGKEIVITVLSALCFAASFVTTKYVYMHTDFLNGFMWVRLGSFVIVPLMFLSRQLRSAFFTTLKTIWSKTGAFFIGNQIIGAGGFFLQSYAIALGSVALVNALQGVQYVFVITLAVFASLMFPKLAGGEDITPHVIIEKLVAVIIVGTGLWILTV